MRRLRLTALVAALLAGCASDENPVGPGSVTVTQSTSTTTTTTVAPTATAQFVFAPTAPAAQQQVFFNGFGSTPGRGTRIVTFTWDFGDGGTATGMSVSHTFSDQALYVVTLTVTDDVGDSAKVSQIVGAIAPPVTTTVPPPPPASSAAQYVGNQTNPIIPSDLTLFFRLLTAASPLPDADAAAGLQTDAAGLQAVDGDFTYTVTGTFRTPNGTTGTIVGRLEGVVEPKPAGDFKGTLTANPQGCSATRNFSGPIGTTALQWVAGSMVRNTCATNPLGWTELNLVQTNAPPVTTTSISSTTTTTVPATTTISTTSTTIPTTTIPSTTTTTIPTTTTSTTSTTSSTTSSTTTTTSMPVLAELIPPPVPGTPLCRLDAEANLVITVRNIGKGSAVASQTSASEFHSGGGGTGTALTPSIAPGGSVDVLIPGFSACRSGCSLTVIVDSQNQVPETDETNNVATGSCVVEGLR